MDMTGRYFSSAVITAVFCSQLFKCL